MGLQALALVVSRATIFGAIALGAFMVYKEYKRRTAQTERGYSNSNQTEPKRPSGRAPPQPGDECAICQDIYLPPLEILPCGHIFHRMCISQWFESRWCCAVCRAGTPDDLKNQYAKRLNISPM